MDVSSFDNYLFLNLSHKDKVDSHNRPVPKPGPTRKSIGKLWICNEPLPGCPGERCVGIRGVGIKHKCGKRQGVIDLKKMSESVSNTDSDSLDEFFDAEDVTPKSR